MSKFICILFGLLALACSPSPTPSPTTQTTARPSATAAQSPSAKPSPTAASCANLPPVYHPARLQLIAACATFKGRVLAVLRERDGDDHLWVAPDAGYEGLLNAANDYHGSKALVAEIVPACTSQPADEAAASHCPASKIAAPAVGAHVVITGPHVLDTVHGWKEIHPVGSLSNA